MKAANAMGVPLDESHINEIDALILDFLKEGRVTPAYCRDRIIEDGHRDEITSAYCGQRLKRLAEHGHAQRVSHSSGLYELVADPRD